MRNARRFHRRRRRLGPIIFKTGGGFLFSDKEMCHVLVVAPAWADNCRGPRRRLRSGPRSISRAFPSEANLQLDWKGAADMRPSTWPRSAVTTKMRELISMIFPGLGSFRCRQAGRVESGRVRDRRCTGYRSGGRATRPADGHRGLLSAHAHRRAQPSIEAGHRSRAVDEGVKLGSKKGSATFQGLTALLAANDIPLQKVTLVDIGFGVQPLLVKQVDAMMGFSMNEPIEAESAGMPVTVMAISDHGVDAYGLMIVSNPELIAKNATLVKGFLKATARGLSDAAKDPAAAVAAVNKAVSESDPARETRKTLIAPSVFPERRQGSARRRLAKREPLGAYDRDRKKAGSHPARPFGPSGVFERHAPRIEMPDHCPSPAFA